MDIDTIITQAARSGMTGYAENLAFLHNRPLPQVLFEARIEEETEAARKQQADESETEGYDRGIDDADQTNDLIFDRHMRALQGAESVIVKALQYYAKLDKGRVEPIETIDNALLAFRGVLDELADSTDLRDQLRSE